MSRSNRLYPAIQFASAYILICQQYSIKTARMYKTDDDKDRIMERVELLMLVFFQGEMIYEKSSRVL